MFRLHFVPLNMTIKNMHSAKTLSRHPEMRLHARRAKDLAVRRTQSQSNDMHPKRWTVNSQKSRLSALPRFKPNIPEKTTLRPNEPNQPRLYQNRPLLPQNLVFLKNILFSPDKTTSFHKQTFSTRKDHYKTFSTTTNHKPLKQSHCQKRKKTPIS